MAKENGKPLVGDFPLTGYSVVELLNHNLELRSSSFTFGRTRTSSVLHSLNHDLFTVDDVDALGKLRG